MYIHSSPLFANFPPYNDKAGLSDVSGDAWGDSRAGRPSSPAECSGRGSAGRPRATSSWSTRASPALTSVSNSATPLLVAPPSHTLSRARRRTGSVSSSETAMASFPAAQIASGLISLLFHSPSISFQWTNHAKNHRVPRCSSRGRSGT